MNNEQARTRQIQEARKEANYNVDDRIEVEISWENIGEILEVFISYIEQETLSKIVSKLDKYDLENLLDELSGFDDSINMGAFIGVIFKEDFSLGEFKADILIKLKEYEEAIFCLEQSNKKFNYILAQVLRMTQKNLNLEDFKDALFDIFEEENIKRALEIIDEKSSLINLEFANEYKNILNLFDSKNKKYI